MFIRFEELPFPMEIESSSYNFIIRMGLEIYFQHSWLKVYTNGSLLTNNLIWGNHFSFFSLQRKGVLLLEWCLHWGITQYFPLILAVIVVQMSARIWNIQGKIFAQIQLIKPKNKIFLYETIPNLSTKNVNG